MLRIEEDRPKSYTERMQEVLAEIPLYSREWTNYNPSDPGITILENLTGFAALQAESILTIPYEVRRRLFALAGFTPGKGKSARVLLKAVGAEPGAVLPAGARFRIGSLIFETNRQVEISGNLVGIYHYSHKEEIFNDLELVKHREVPVGAEIFGETPTEGDALYLVTDRLPEAGKEIIFHITLQAGVRRNPIENRTENVFASMRWECFTAAGWREMGVRDYTGCFLTNGELRLKLPQEAAAICNVAPTQGYCIRGTLTRAAYDISPRVSHIESFLFEVWQRDTRAANLIINRTDRITVRHPLASDEHIIVFAKEEKGASYRRYQLSYSGDEGGRVCKYKPGQLDENGRQREFTIEFTDPEYHPSAKLKEPVRIVLYSEAIMRQYAIGTVLGYDDQELELPLQHLVQDSFCLIARRPDGEGGFIYDFVRPGKHEENALSYHLLENDGRVVIEDAGAYIGAELFVGGLAVTEGERGNVRAGGRFIAQKEIPGVTFYSPGPGTGGAYRETLAQMGERLRRDINTPYTAVTAQDYEQIVLQTPALCLRKAHAVIDEVENLVRIAVLPATGGDQPVLSETYRREILRYLEDRRLITTRIEILPPQIVDIHLRGTIYVKRHYNNPRQMIEDAVHALLDDMESERNFGEPLLFRTVFSAIEELPCVSFVYEMSLQSDDRELATVRDTDIYPRADVLCRTGNIALELVAYE